jgi:hypothetical protein
MALRTNESRWEDMVFDSCPRCGGEWIEGQVLCKCACGMVYSPYSGGSPAVLFFGFGKTGYVYSSRVYWFHSHRSAIYMDDNAIEIAMHLPYDITEDQLRTYVTFQ